MTNRGPSMVLGDVQWGPDRYPALWIWEGYEEPKEVSGNKRYGEYWSFPLHRLNAFAHGVLDSPRFEDPIWIIDGQNDGEVRTDADAREVHHVDEDKMNGSPNNLEAHEPEYHGQITNGTV